METKNNHAKAFGAYRKAVAEAVRWHSPDYSDSGIWRERARRVAEARKALMAALPAEAKATGPSPAEFVQSLRPTTADQVAVADFEWRQAQTLIDAGRPIEAVIHDASPARARAIAAYIDTLPRVLESRDPAGVTAEVQALVFDRLVAAGDADAVAVADTHRAVESPNAWREFLEGAVTGSTTIGVQSRLAAVDPEGFAEAQSFRSPLEDGETNARIDHIDQLVASGRVSVAG